VGVAHLNGATRSAWPTHDKQVGLQTMCVGGGEGMAMIIERLS
jgi:acetyl-CoA acetyltransferase